MPRITKLEEDIKHGSKTYEAYQERLNNMVSYQCGDLAGDNSFFSEAVDAAEEVIEILFSRYKK